MPGQALRRVDVTHPAQKGENSGKEEEDTDHITKPPSAEKYAPTLLPAQRTKPWTSSKEIKTKKPERDKKVTWTNSKMSHTNDVMKGVEKRARNAGQGLPSGRGSDVRQKERGRWCQGAHLKRKSPHLDQPY